MKMKNEIQYHRKFPLFEYDYWTLVNKIETDTETGKVKKDQPEISDEDLISRILEKHEVKGETEILFTDGSKTEQGRSTGIGIIVKGEEEGFQLSINKRCSVYSAELLGIELALGIVKDRGTTGNVLILSDSKSAVETIGNNDLTVYKNEAALKIRKMIYNLQEEGSLKNNKKIVIAWIPGHSGIIGNEDADEIAKEATMETMDDRIKVPLGDWRSINKETEIEKNNKSIEEIGRWKGKKYFDVMHSREGRKPWFNKMNEARSYVTMINRMRANHTNVRESLQRKGYIEENHCDCGAGIEDLEHLIFRCGKHDENREIMYINLEREKVPYPYILEEWLKNIRSTPLMEVWRFLKRIRRII